MGLVSRGEWDTELAVEVYCGGEPAELEAGVRGDVMEEDGKDAEERKDVVVPEWGRKEVDDVTDGECGTLVRETKVDGKLVGREEAVGKDGKEGETVELWGTEDGLSSEGEVFAVVNEE